MSFPRPSRSRLELPERGVELSLVDFGGSGAPALLCHANGFCAALWEPIAAHLRTTHRVFAYDARGHGDSPAPDDLETLRWSELCADLLAVSQRLLRAPFTRTPGARLYAIGHSMGGTQALAAATRHPEPFARIALLDPVLVPAAQLREDGQHPGVRLAELVSHRRAHFASRDEVRERYRERPPFASWDPAVFELYVQEGFAPDAGGGVELRCRPEIEAAIYRRNDLAARGHTEKLGVPGLLWFAAQGNFSREFGREVAGSTGVRFEEIDGGHLFPMEAPRRTAERLSQFAEED